VKAKLALASLGLFVLAGCNKFIVGKWNIENTADLKTAKVIIQHLELDDNGMFKAKMIENKQIVEKSGKYQFNGFQLKLGTKEGDQVWNAMVIMNKTLQLSRGGDKNKLTRVEK
jgi:hypothetical protein